MYSASDKTYDPIIEGDVDTAGLVLSVATVIAGIASVAAFVLNDARIAVLIGVVALFSLALSLMCFNARGRHRPAPTPDEQTDFPSFTRV